MPSPFPGMDPYLESVEVFPDLHDRLIGAISEALNARLPPPFYSALAGRVWLDDERQIVPDVQVVRGPERTSSGGTAVLEASATAFIEVGLEVEPTESRENFVEIYGPGKRLITSIKLLSPASKTGTQRERYIDKQMQLFLDGVNVVEIDLLRRGPHATLAPFAALEQYGTPYDYHASIARPGPPGRCQIAAIRLTQPLPTLPIPLTGGVADVILDLQAAFARTYDAALYARRVNYAAPCEPPLSADSQAWANGILNPGAT